MEREGPSRIDNGRGLLLALPRTHVPYNIEKQARTVDKPQQHETNCGSGDLLYRRCSIEIHHQTRNEKQYYVSLASRVRIQHDHSRENSHETSATQDKTATGFPQQDRQADPVSASLNPTIGELELAVAFSHDAAPISWTIRR